MIRFTRLFQELDRTTRTSEKTAALERYFREAEPADAAWALRVLTGNRLIRRVNTRLLRQWVAEVTGYPGWLVDESYGAVGDLSETLALLLPSGGVGVNEPLHRVIVDHILPLPTLDEAGQRELILDTWATFDTEQRFLFHKLISGAFRVGASKKLVTNALAAAAGIDAAVMQHRLMGDWQPTAEDYARLISGEDRADEPGRPYPFYLASQLDDPPDTLGDLGDWQVEWKWDGIRAQLIRRGGNTLVWSRGEEGIADAFPELRQIGEALPDGTVLDGEIVAWESDRPLPFSALQRRLNRKRVEAMLFQDVPVVYVAYDLLERDGKDLRERSTIDRRAMLEAMVDAIDEDDLLLSPLIDAASWDELGEQREQSRQRGVEGMMLKRKTSPYGVGRKRGDWWKWKVDPFTVDAVMIYAQLGTGKRASLYTDYTFAVWHDGELTPIAKAYSGLNDDEIDEVDRFVRRNTLDRRGPVRVVRPELVFELAFEGINASTRHRSGIALRFPRMAHWRKDKPAQEADTLENLQRLLAARERGVSP